MADQAYQFSRWIYNIMEGFFNWAWSLVTSGRLDFFFAHWFLIVALVSAAAFTIDMLFYYLREGRRTLAVKFIMFVYSLFKKLYYKIKGKEIPPEDDFADGDYHSGEPDTYQRGFYMDAPAFEPSTFEYERYTPPASGESVVTREDIPAPEEQPNRQGDISYILPEIMHDDEELTTDKRPSDEPFSNIREFPAAIYNEEMETPTDEQ